LGYVIGPNGGTHNYLPVKKSRHDDGKGKDDCQIDSFESIIVG